MKRVTWDNIHQKSLLVYGSFFLFYFLAIYLSLYHSLDLGPFQINVHFFSNALSTLVKRYLADVLPYAFLFFLIYYSRLKSWRILWISVFFGIFLLNIAEIGFYNQTQNHFQPFVLEGFRQRIFLDMLGVKRMVILVLLMLFSVVWGIFLWKMEKKDKRKLSLREKTLILILFLVALNQAYSPVFYHFSDTLTSSDHIKKKLFHLISLEDSGMEVFGRYAMNHFLQNDIDQKTLSAEEKKEIETAGFNRKKVTFFSETPKNIILIVAESLNQDFISYYNPLLQDSTPFLDSLLTEHEKIDLFYPSGPYTIHGMNALLCGHTNLDYGRFLKEHVCSAQLIKEQGYRTELIRGFSKFYIGENLTFKKFGFDTTFAQEEFDLKYPDFKSQRPDLYSTWGYSDNFLFKEAIERLQTHRDEKQFLTLLTVDTHTPGGRCFDEPFNDSDENKILFSVKCLDRHLKSFFEEMKEKDLLKDSLILITSDQLFPNVSQLPGENFQTSFKLTPGKIPFIMVADQNFNLKANQGSQVDVAATLLDAVNAPIPDYYFGKSLLSNQNTIPVGQSGKDAFVKSAGQFQHFSLHDEALNSSQKNSSLQMNVQINHPTDLFVQIAAAREALATPHDPPSLLFKWYYNKYYYNEIK